MRRAALSLLLVPLLAACGSASEAAPSGLDEPVRVRFTPAGQTMNVVPGQFFPGPLPSGTLGPSVSISNNQVLVFPGQVGKHITGDASAGATGPAMREHGSAACCTPAGRRTEDVMWGDIPTPGLRPARVGMFSAGGEPATNFLFELYVQNELQLSLPGRLIAIDADNGAGP